MSEEKKDAFIHLHVHTEYSLLDGAARIQRGKSFPLIDECIKKNMPACAITDHGNMYGAYAFYKAAKERGIKPIIGCEFYTTEDMGEKNGRQTDLCHLVLLAKNEQGYKNLVKLDSLAFIDGFYYKPRIDLEILKKHSNGLVCLSGCLQGKIPKLLLQNDYQNAKEYALRLKEIFADGDFYIEIQNHGIDDQLRSNPLLVKLARELGVKPVATNDVHYISREDAEMHDLLLCVQTGRTLDDPTRMRFGTQEFYLKDRAEMDAALGWCQEALETPFEIADKCNVEIKPHKLMPPYEPADGSTPAEFIRKLAFEGVYRRYKVVTEEILARMEYELKTIIELGFAEYYLIVWDFIDYASKNDIPVGAGRGSGVGSLVAYSMGITNVDPLKYNLIFERFLNTERVSNPDFDIDFCFEGRERVKEYVVNKYGSDKVCEIITFGTEKPRAAIKDIARVYSIPFDRVNAITKLIPFLSQPLEELLGLTFDEKGNRITSALISELRELYDSDPLIKTVLDMAIKIEGMPRHSGKHAAGVVICKEVISDYVPLQTSSGDITTQFTKDEVEELGMLKMDFLGLKTLTDVKLAKRYIYKNYGKKIDFGELGYEDHEVYKLIASGDTDAVFQLESAGMKRFMQDLQPHTFEDIIAGVSLFRPGPMSSIPKFIEGKRNKDKVVYDHQALKSILEPTYGCIVYQEQVMQIAQVLGGYTLGRADVLRKAMGKKKAEVMRAEKEIFVHGAPADEKSTAVEGATKRGVSEAVAIKIFEDMEDFAKYAFNKSHAAAYAVLAYETAYLKRYYKKEFVTAVINNRLGNTDEVAKYITYLTDSGIKVLPPNINKSEVYFSTEGNAVRFGLMGIKNVGEVAIEALIAEREEKGAFKSALDVIKRCDVPNKRMVESLIMAGAFDCFGETRATLKANYEDIMAYAAAEKKQRAGGQLSLFDILGVSNGDNDGYEMKRIAETDKKESLVEEKAVTGVYMSGHPLDEYREQIRNGAFSLKKIDALLHTEEGDADSDETATGDTGQLAAEWDGRRVSFAVILNSISRRVTKTGSAMATGRVEDLYGTIDIIVFPQTYEKYKLFLEKDSVLQVTGTLQTIDRLQLRVDSVMPLEDRGESTTSCAEEVIAQKKIYINLVDAGRLSELVEVLDAYKGDTPVFYQADGKLYDTRCLVAARTAAILELKSTFGDKNVKIVENR